MGNGRQQSVLLAVAYFNTHNVRLKLETRPVAQSSSPLERGLGGLKQIKSNAVIMKVWRFDCSFFCKQSDITLIITADANRVSKLYQPLHKAKVINQEHECWDVFNKE